MTTKLEIQQLLNEDWSTDPNTLEVCTKILEYLSNTDVSQVKHLSFVSIKNITEEKDLRTLIKAVNYLTGAKVPLLDTNFEFIDDKDTSYPLSQDEYHQIVTEHEFFHPETGEPVAEYKKRIFIYFTPSIWATTIRKEI